MARGRLGSRLRKPFSSRTLSWWADARGAGEADRGADLAHAGRVAPGLDGLLDGGQDALLTRGEAGRVRRAVGHLDDLAAAVLAGHVLPPADRRGSNLSPDADRDFKHLFEARVARRADRTRRTNVRPPPCVVRTHALLSNTCSIERLSDPPPLSVAPSRQIPHRSDTTHRLTLPLEANMSTATFSPTIVGTATPTRTTVRAARSRGRPCGSRVVAGPSSSWRPWRSCSWPASSSAPSPSAPTRPARRPPPRSSWSSRARACGASPPSSPPRATSASAMREIERLNALDSVALSAGQKLRVPVSDD